ncbi:RT0821/Lpp0805 family surface protein [Oricola sp.]|uniref:RT0821/Lpp0805 family surface protein n=1 Tax=Oricola sp. TaxID=1979950 RepID=UPI0025E39A76|nr:RT0821/Lpp0805 family surface protein [Oricola sp.]MCI5076728.1 RT0821/Lpp0805 family surface protein [Oricola sp.]
MQLVLDTIGAFSQGLNERVVSGVKIAAAIGIATALSACSMTGKGLDEAAVGVSAIADETMAVSKDPFKSATDAEGTERDRLLDEDTIRNAVTSADLRQNAAEPLAWANQSTGSKGVITGITQRDLAGQTCRSFNATREAYNGVTLYKGDLCLDRRSGWWTRILAPLRVGKDA